MARRPGAGRGVEGAVGVAGQAQHASAAEVLRGDDSRDDGDRVPGADQVHLQQRVRGGEAGARLDARRAQIGALPDARAGGGRVQRPRRFDEVAERARLRPLARIRQHQQERIAQQRLAVGPAPHHALSARIVLPQDHVVPMREQTVIGIADLLLRHLQLQQRVVLGEHAHRGRGERDHRSLEGGDPQHSGGLALREHELGLGGLRQSEHLLAATGEPDPGFGEHDPPPHLLEQGDLGLPLQQRELLGDGRGRHRMRSRDRRHRPQPVQFVQQEQPVQVQHVDLRVM